MHRKQVNIRLYVVIIKAILLQTINMCIYESRNHNLSLTEKSLQLSSLEKYIARKITWFFSFSSFILLELNLYFSFFDANFMGISGRVVSSWFGVSAAVTYGYVTGAGTSVVPLH